MIWDDTPADLIWSDPVHSFTSLSCCSVEGLPVVEGHISQSVRGRDKYLGYLLTKDGWKWEAWELGMGYQ